MARLPRPTLGVMAILATVAGVVFLILRPPALTGAEGLLSVLVGAVLLVLLSACATVALMGRDGMSEPEFERVVERSERLAEGEARGSEPTSEFDELVADAIDRLPEDFQQVLQQVPIVVSRRGRAERAYGHYHGDTVAREAFEDRIVLYQDTLERDFGHDDDLLAAEIERTLRHELAHHLGWAESGVRDLGL